MTFTVVDTNSPTGNNGVVVSSRAVTGGTLYVTTAKGLDGVRGVTSSFVPSATAQVLNRYLSLTSARADTGAVLTATAGSGNMGISRTAGTSLALVGEATSSSALTDKAMFEFNLPDTYVSGSNIPVLVNCIVTGTGTLTGASTTITVAAYSETAGVEAALVVSAAQVFDKTGEVLTFTITGTGLTTGQHIVLELVMLVTSASGANTGKVTSVAYSA